MSANHCFMDKDRGCDDSCKAFSAESPSRCVLLNSVRDVLSQLHLITGKLTAYRHPDPPTIGRHV